MSETFYIKKTAFDDNNFNLATREADSFIIGPGELNGPGGLAQDSDLELYGFGSLKWGEGVNQNQYRQLESNACPAKVDGDFLAGGADGNTDFLVGTHGIVPKSEEDLGIGNGITQPLYGQLWYNTSDEILYNYELTGWETVFKEVHDILNTHAADTTLHLDANQNTFLDGLTLPTLTSTEVNQLIGMGNTAGVFTVQGQLDLMVEKAGDIMTGDLTIAKVNPSLNLQYSATGVALPQVVIGTATTERANFRFTESTGDVTIFRRNSGGGIETELTLTNNGNVTVDAPAPTADAHLTRRDFITDNYAPLVSPALTGNPTAPTPATSDNDTSIATTAFVKAQSTSIGKFVQSGSSGSTVVPSGINQVYYSLVGGGGGGAAGGDGGDFAGDTGNTGGTSSITVPGVGTRSVRGGRGGLGTQNANNHEWVSRGENAGYGVSTRGGRGRVGNGGKGGDGGGTEIGSGGLGSANLQVTAGSGGRGGGGGGGWGQDNAAGNGGDSGNFIRELWPCTAGTTITWSIGGGGAGGVNAVGTARWGGAGGSGWIVLQWSST